MTRSFLAAVHVVLLTLLPTCTLAQSIPIGACVLPSGQWCIPPSKSRVGETCYCLTADGWRKGQQY